MPPVPLCTGKIIFVAALAHKSQRTRILKISALLPSLRLMVASFIQPAAGAAPENTGRSLLGMCNKTWDCAETETLFPADGTLIFRWLDGGSLGTDCPCVRDLLANPRARTLAPHIASADKKIRAGKEPRRLGHQHSNQRAVHLEVDSMRASFLGRDIN